MRTTLATLVLGAGLVVGVLPAAPASAYCDIDLQPVAGCANACTLVGYGWTTVRERVGSKLPDFQCPY